MPDFPIRFGRYDLLDLLSSGGMAEVYLARSIAEDPRNRRAVAIKRVLPYLSKDVEFIRMFEKEIGLTFQMTHPNLVKVYESGYIDGQYFIAMEHLLGRTLSGFMSDGDSMQHLRETPFACYVVREVSKALDYAHNYRDPVTNKSFGIVHRDISPQNIMISYSGEVKLFDFGVAKGLVKEGSTTAGVIKGKPAYIAPEQVLGKSVDRRTDIFSLGVVFWEMLTGQRLFFDEQPLVCLRNVVEMEILPPSAVNKASPPEFDEIVMKSLCREPKLRYQSANELIAAIDRAVASRYKEFGDAHFSWMMRYFFEHEAKVAQEDVDYKLRLPPAGTPAKPESGSKSTIVPPKPKMAAKPAPIVQKSNPAPRIVPDTVVDDGVKGILKADLSSLLKHEWGLKVRVSAAVILFLLGALGHYAVDRLFIHDELSRAPAGCEQKK